MTNVTNKHTSRLNIAGVEIDPGATVAVPKFDRYSKSRAIKTWLDMGIIETDAKEPKEEVKAERKAEDEQRAAVIPGLPADGDKPKAKK